MKEQQQELRALLVEDDDGDASIFCRHAGKLVQPRLRVTRAASEQDATDRIEADQYDIVFVDLNLGGRDSGMRLVRQLQGRNPNVATIVVTGSGDEDKAVEAMKSGAHDYIVKDNLTPALLARSIQNVRERLALDQERARMVEKLAELSVTDELTGIANRRHLTQKLEEEIGRSERTGHLFCVLMIDLDHFKLVNDRFGHPKGDEVLRQVAAALKGNLRRTDVVARYGGEEFCVVLPETAPQGARRVAENLRKAVKSLPPPVPTISVGLAFWRPNSSVDSIIREVDEALYEAKAAGRDCVVTCGTAKPPPPDVHPVDLEADAEPADSPARPSGA